MSRCSKLKIIFCIKIFFALINAITSNDEIYEKMSLKERRSFFGTEDGSVPEVQVVELVTPSRSKRSPLDPINITIDNDGDILVVTLKAVQDHDLISSSLTGLWHARTDLSSHQNVYYDPRPELIPNLGSIDFFQNFDDSAAITRFQDAEGNENYIGTLKLKYVIKSVPKTLKYVFLNNFDKHGVAKKCANAINDENEESHVLAIFKINGIPQKHFHRRDYGESAAHSDLHRSRRESAIVPDVVYSKLLIIPDYDLVSHYTTVEEFLKVLIAQVNGVDMLYRQLKDPEVHLTITGIIIPQDTTATPYLSEYTDDNNYINIDYAADVAHKNFQKEERRFPFDTWDVVIVLSTHGMFARAPDTKDFIVVQGIGLYNKGCIGGSAVMQWTEGIEGIHHMAHELGHLFNVRHDEEGTSAKCKIDSGYTMVPNFSWSRKLDWSACSRDVLKTFFRSELGNCTYSRPEEVEDDMVSMPGPWLSLDGQCDNHYTGSTEYCHMNGSAICDKIGCKVNDVCYWIFKRPLEGSTYWDNDVLKACIQGLWKPV